LSQDRLSARVKGEFHSDRGMSKDQKQHTFPSAKPKRNDVTAKGGARRPKKGGIPTETGLAQKRGGVKYDLRKKHLEKK